ncbi:Isochorismatase-like protein [Phlyctochytrium arcticum]|nr:Isochorismatase-like protein [Phlyctochytrium arcticum]
MAARNPLTTNKRKLALLVIDMQGEFQRIVEPIIERVEHVRQVCHLLGIDTVMTQHGHANANIDGKALARWWGPENCIMEGSSAHRLLISPSDADRVIHKKTYDAFYETELDEVLKARKINTVVISGTMTNLCCETTARSAFVRNYDVWFLSDGTACRTPEMQQATLMNIGYGFGKILTCSEFVECIKAAKSNLA